MFFLSFFLSSFNFIRFFFFFLILCLDILLWLILSEITRPQLRSYCAKCIV
jgi:hypothetical protein